MKSLTPAEKRALRTRAHALHPVVIVGHGGLTPAVLNEIDVSLRAHELVKIRVATGDRAQREDVLACICAGLDAAAVQHLGKLLIVWRPRPEAADGATAGKPVAHKSKATRRRAATSAPQLAAAGPSTATTRARPPAGKPAARRPREARQTPAQGRGVPATSRRRRTA
jgi:putative YhbY family RNA-binding protein